ncbi:MULTISPECIES: hypothetical protein [Marivita]|jgi:hypothetical protein|uniref:Uncharacterized protein n=2 Tax=Marivita cryptomonadis TaxID=505252 RepID=A0A9Q2S2Y7_9RHOB|nr:MULTISPECIES: hypothetical protein [Marivita]MCR9169360.1 hypothetical protein [Paracoccaceae bacterium]MBM2322846.1 hypothetical protein [Marivita cryptomonadis]MBM2332428.1 hypothetical protein [Marivita cryptomonadis]MBM2342012.1 hypothetical protein [Marivita cryptomonadis]MBM2346676.1 hypothetical protein [Marivita cryptomonadis]
MFSNDLICPWCHRVSGTKKELSRKAVRKSRRSRISHRVDSRQIDRDYWIEAIVLFTSLGGRK